MIKNGFMNQKNLQGGNYPNKSGVNQGGHWILWNFHKYTLSNCKLVSSSQSADEATSKRILGLCKELVVWHKDESENLERYRSV